MNEYSLVLASTPDVAGLRAGLEIVNIIDSPPNGTMLPYTLHHPSSQQLRDSPLKWRHLHAPLW